jgi:hypothetical protein
VDAASEQALREAIRGAIAADLDELDARLAALEAGRPFTRAEYLANRRRTAAELHERGVSAAEIGRRLGVARSTAMRDIEPQARPPGPRVG